MWRHRHRQYDVIITSYEILKNQEELMKTLLYLISYNLWRWRHTEISKRPFDLKLKTDVSVFGPGGFCLFRFKEMLC